MRKVVDDRLKAIAVNVDEITFDDKKQNVVDVELVNLDEFGASCERLWKLKTYNKLQLSQYHLGLSVHLSIKRRGEPRHFDCSTYDTKKKQKKVFNYQKEAS